MINAYTGILDALFELCKYSSTLLIQVLRFLDIISIIMSSKQTAKQVQNKMCTKNMKYDVYV